MVKNTINTSRYEYNLDEFIIMPGHFYAIIVIGENPVHQNKFRGNYHGRHAMHGVSTMTKTW